MAATDLGDTGSPERVLYWLYQRKTMNIKCLPRIRGVPTSFYKLNMMFSTNQGTLQDYSSLHQIKAVAHVSSYLYSFCLIYFNSLVIIYICI